MNAKNGKETLANSLSTKVRVYIPRVTYTHNIDTFIISIDKGVYTISTNGYTERIGRNDQFDWDTVGTRIQNLKSLPYPVLIGIRDLL